MLVTEFYFHEDCVDLWDCSWPAPKWLPVTPQTADLHSLGRSPNPVTKTGLCPIRAFGEVIEVIMVPLEKMAAML